MNIKRLSVAIFVGCLGTFSLLLYAQRTDEGYVYIVKQGDTLWELSQRFLNNPWLWPKVWEQNRYITNPHLIFPGDPISLGISPPAVAALPAPPVAGLPLEAKESALSQEEMAAGPGEPAPAPVEGGLSEEEMLAVPEGTAEPAQTEESLGELLKIEAISEGSIYYGSASATGFVTREELESAGSIVGTKMERKMLGQNDDVYISTIEGNETGQKFTIFKTIGKLKHPVTGESLGYRIKILGELEVIEKSEDTSVARITRAYDVISKGDRLSPIEPVKKEIVLRSSIEQIDGYIVATQDDLKLIGEGQIVYIDRGTADGIVEGNVFTVYRPEKKVKEQITGRELFTPVETIGKLVVIKVRENVSTALVTKSKKELGKGERIISEVF